MTALLTAAEQEFLDGRHGDGAAVAMRIVVRLAEAMGADRLRSIEGAHIDSCLFHGHSGIDFVERLVDGGAHVSVPTTLNVSSLDLIHPERFLGSDADRSASQRLMDGYVALGCEATWTCAPYQREQRPGFGSHVAWAESNAIVFANSVLGARTHRYGDFIDISAAITGRVPHAGLHLDAERLATIVIDVGDLHPALWESSVLAPVLGVVVGRCAGTGVPVIDRCPAEMSEDALKALGAAAASSGSVGLFHVVGVTPEAPTLDAITRGHVDEVERVVVTPSMLADAAAELSTAVGERPLRSVSLGTPHYSVDEIATLAGLLGERRVHPDVDVFVSTGRDVLAEANLRGDAERCRSAGVKFVVDTCTYITPILRAIDGIAMTDSAKWAWYAPGNIGAEVVFADVTDCIESAIAGKLRVRVDESWWTNPLGESDS